MDLHWVWNHSADEIYAESFRGEDHLQRIVRSRK